MECIKLIENEEVIELNARQKKAIMFLLSAKTVKEAAKLAKVRLPTLYKWLKIPLFYNELERLRTEILSDTVATLKVLSLEAVSTLADLMRKSESENVKRGSATDILDNCRSFIQMRDLELRLSKIEEALETPSSQQRTINYVSKTNY